MRTLTVDLGTRSYPIVIGQNLFTQTDLITPYVQGKQVMLVSNTTVAPLYLAQAEAMFAAYQPKSVVLPDGEQYKNVDILNQIFDALLTHHCDRKTTLVALGGGVVGDMTGFAAACYQRGVAFIQIPTTLLSQVDSSVGGKTGVNHRLGKNMIGAFHQPRCVVIDTETLNTLPERELSAGLAEVVKYGLINDVEFFAWLEQHADTLMARDPVALSEAIERSCANKARIVAQDEKEGGVRALLNLGHTFGHAIETGMGYGVCLHGEAVAIGMVLAAEMSARLGWMTDAEVERARALLQKMQLPTQIPSELHIDNLLATMQVDKKVQDGVLRLILLKGIGQAVISSDYSASVLRTTLQHGFA